jgi:hypothetical protein
MNESLAFVLRDNAYIFKGVQAVNDTEHRAPYMSEINRLSDQLMINFARSDLPHSDENEDFFSSIAMKEIHERTDEESHFLSRVFSHPKFAEKHGNNLYVLRLQAFRILAAGAEGMTNETIAVKKLPKTYKPFQA